MARKPLIDESIKLDSNNCQVQERLLVGNTPLPDYDIKSLNEVIGHYFKRYLEHAVVKLSIVELILYLIFDKFNGLSDLTRAFWYATIILRIRRICLYISPPRRTASTPNPRSLGINSLKTSAVSVRSVLLFFVLKPGPKATNAFSAQLRISLITSSLLFSSYVCRDTNKVKKATRISINVAKALINNPQSCKYIFTYVPSFWYSAHSLGQGSVVQCVIVMVNSKKAIIKGVTNFQYVFMNVFRILIPVLLYKYTLWHYSITNKYNIKELERTSGEVAVSGINGRELAGLNISAGIP